MIVTNTFQCLPSGLHFAAKKSVRLTIPHCANLIDPKKVQAVLYSWNHGEEGEGSYERLLLTSKTCQVTPRTVEIFLQHFSLGFLAFITDWWYMRGKKNSFMPFLPRTMPPSRITILELRIVDKPSGTSWRLIHEFKKDGYYQPAKDDDDEMNVSNEDLKVSCQLDDNIILDKNVKANSLMKKSKHTLYFRLDFNDKPNDLPVKLELKQADDEMDIEFMTRLTETTGTASLPSEERVTLTDTKLEILSEKISDDDYTNFCSRMGITFDQAKSILGTNNGNYRGAVRECLAKWKNRTGAKVDELTEILKELHLEDKIQYVE